MWGCAAWSPVGPRHVLHVAVAEGIGGNDADRVEHGCHSVVRKASRVGGSNLAFVDGSARFLKYGADTWPLDLWFISDSNRLAGAFIAP